MKKEILEISDKLCNNKITEKEARNLLLNLFILSDNDLKERGLTIKYVDYGLWQLRQDGEFLMEAERMDCNERAIEILSKTP
jgi:hypothetical protein